MNDKYKHMSQSIQCWKSLAAQWKLNKHSDNSMGKMPSAERGEKENRGENTTGKTAVQENWKIAMRQSYKRKTDAARETH